MTMPQVTNSDIMHKLGGIEKELEHGARSRGILHQKVEQQSDALNKAAQALVGVTHNLEVNTQIATQARDVAQGALENLHRFETTFNEVHLPLIAKLVKFQEEANPLVHQLVQFKNESNPMIAQMKIVRNIIYGLFAAGILTAGSFIGLAFWARDNLRAFLFYVLNIDLP